VRTPWTALGGCPLAVRLTPTVHGVAANEWKDLLPATHTPRMAPGGGYYEIAHGQPGDREAGRCTDRRLTVSSPAP
jgi:hypothetical protein